MIDLKSTRIVLASTLALLVAASCAVAEDDENVDHAGIISAWDQQSFERGKKIYTSMCFACHGIDGKKVTNPDARPFATGVFKQGTDPYSIYKTITDGLNDMPSQVWMTPEQRYDCIHYIREQFLKDQNKTQYFKVTNDYLNGLPKFDPIKAAKNRKPTDRDYGPVLAAQLETRVGNGLHFRLPHEVTVCYDLHRMNIAGAWQGGFLDLSQTQHFRQRGERMPKPAGNMIDGLQTWKWSYNNTFDYPEEKIPPRGPVPTDWMKYRGHYLYGPRAIMSYEIEGRGVLESPSVEKTGDKVAIIQTLHVEPGQKAIKVALGEGQNAGVGLLGAGEFEAKAGPAQTMIAVWAHGGKNGANGAAGLLGDTDGCKWEVDAKSRAVLHIPPSDKPLNIQVVRTATADEDAAELVTILIGLKKVTDIVPDLSEMTKGGPKRWRETFTVKGELGESVNGYAMDTVPVPFKNPWNAWVRTSAIDFFSDGRAALTTYGGDVWVVSGLDDDLEEVTWSRYACGMFELMGVKIIDDVVYVTARDGIKRLHDYNNDGEVDYYECFFMDFDLSRMFHAFNFDLQRDSKGNLYYAKSGQYTNFALPGAIVKVPPQGGSYEIHCVGIRTPNGMGILPDDRVLVSDNQGPWMPAGKVSITKPGGFYGNPPQKNWKQAPGEIGYNPETFDQPIIWMPQNFDNSCGGQLWVSDKRFGPLAERLMHTSFGKGWAYYMMLQEFDDISQAAIIKLPFQFDAGTQRLRQNPADGQVYLTGLSGWQGPKGGKDGCLQRLRYTGEKCLLVDDVKVQPDGLLIRFNFELDTAKSARPEAFDVKQWNYAWTAKYGSPQFSVKDPEKKGRDPITFAEIKAGGDGKSIYLKWPEIAPVDQVEINLNVTAKDGAKVERQIYLTINGVPKERTAAK